MTVAWYILTDGVPNGPMSSAQLQQLGRLGKVTAETQVAKEKDGPWVPASRVKGLFPPSPVFTPEVPHFTLDSEGGSTPPTPHTPKIRTPRPRTTLRENSMDTSRLEELLEQLVDKQDELISRIESLETSLVDKQDELISQIESLETTVKDSLSSIHDELNWWGEGHSFAKQLLSELGDLSTTLNSIDFNTTQ